MSARFSVVRALGRGATGHVELVRDAATGEVLACKRLIRLEPTRIRALKRELRLVGSLVHPNLVQVYELGEDEDGPFLLMEAVDGLDVVSHCTGAGSSGLELASVVPQLLAVLRYLHQRGLVHGDLSPANVLVRRDGCVKLLDFGLGGALEDPRAPSGGTPGFIAPERLRGLPPSGASDLYALGALLQRIADRRAPADAPTPTALDDAIRSLLDPSPDRRPSLDSLERTLLPALSATRSSVTAAPSGRLRREALEARIFGTLIAGPGQLIALRGRSGIGKTTLARAVASRAAEAGMSVSWTRARPEERVAFNLLDELVDDAAQRITVDAATPELREALERASSAFPTLSKLGGAEAHAERVRRRVRAQLFGHADRTPTPPRASLFADVRLLLEAADAGAPRRLLILDDLQWADRDSIAFVESLLDAGSPRTTLLATTRDDAGETTASWLTSRHDVVLVDVPPLSVDEVAAYLQTQGPFLPAAAERVAAACEGLPALVELSLRSPGGQDPLSETVRAVVRDGEPSEKAALAMLLVAGAPLGVGHASMPPRALDLLVRRGLVTRTGSAVELMHDSLRAPLRLALGPDWLRAAHESRASQLGSAADAGAERVRHLLEAGRAGEAATLAEQAAEQARARSAFDLAAELYEVARSRLDAPELRRRHAEVLEEARRFEEAARVWAELSEAAAPGEDRAALRLAEAHALLAGRRIREGRARLDEALQLSGAPRLGGGALRRAATIVRFVAGPLPALLPGAPSLAGAERYLKSAALVGYFDTGLGLELLLRARATFDRGGDAERAAWCDFLLSFFARFGVPRGAGLARRYRRAAERRLTRGAARSAVVRAFPVFLEGYDALRSARFGAAAETFDVALDIVAGTGEERSFEAQLTTSLRTSAVLATQNVDAAEAAVVRFEALAREGVAVAIQCHVENARALVLTWRGRFEEAEELMGRLRARWPSQPETVQSVLIELYAALPAVLLGDAARVRPRVRDACRRAQRMRLFHTAYAPVIAGIAAYTEIAARSAGDADLASARGWAELCAARPSVLTGLGHRVLAALDELSGRPDRALERLVRAEREALRLGQAIDAALARFGRGRLEPRAALQIDARSQLAAAGASPRLLVEHDVLRRASARP